MMRLLNILAIIYLAAAPGMNVGQLIHAVDLCRLADPAGHQQAVQAESHCPHHAPRPEPKPEPQDCPHMHEVAMPTPAMPAVQPVSTTSAALPALHLPLFEVLAPQIGLFAATDTVRPPPGPPLVGITILLV